MQRGSTERLVFAAVSAFILVKVTKLSTISAVTDVYQDQARILRKHIVSIPSIEVRTHPEEREYQQNRDRFGWVQPALLVAAVIAAFFSAYAAREAARQALASEEANRPWLQIESVHIDGAGVDHRYNFAYARFTVGFRNIGHSPARRIFARAQLKSINLDNEAFFDLPRNVCLSATPPEAQFLGGFKFPDQNGITRGSADRDLNEIKLNFERSRVRYGGSDTWGRFAAAAQFELYGCLLYEDEKSIIRRTAFVYQLTPFDLTGKDGDVAGVRGIAYYLDGIYAD